MAQPAPGFEAFHTFQQSLTARIAAAREELDADPDDLLKQERVQVLLAVQKDLDAAAQPDYEKGYKTRDNVFALQVALYFIGGSWVGQSALERPAEAYMDARQRPKKYGRKDFEKLVKGLLMAAESLGMNAHDMPRLPTIDNCGVGL